MSQSFTSTYASVESYPEAKSAKAGKRMWTTADSIAFERAYKIHGNRWKKIEKEMGNRSKHSIRKYAERIGYIERVGKSKRKGITNKRNERALSCVIDRPGAYLPEENSRTGSTRVDKLCPATDKGLKDRVEEEKGEASIDFRSLDTLLLARAQSASNSSLDFSTNLHFNGYRPSIFSEDDPLH